MISFVDRNELDGSVAVVTGAAAGIGRAVAVSLAEAGAAVALADLDESAAIAAVSEMGANGHRAVALRCDVTCEDDVVALAACATEQLGPVSVWVNNAGSIRPAMLHKMTLADFEAVLATHVRGTFLGMREAARRMIAARVRGSIINVTSAAGLAGTIGQINYAAAKGAIVGSAARPMPTSRGSR